MLTASQRCDELGIDTISAAGTIAFAMECVQRGLLDESWLRFGDGDALLRALDMIASGEGLGRRLAEGSRPIGPEIGHDSLEFAPQVKGLEIPGYDPRGLQTMALGFAVGTRGLITIGPALTKSTSPRRSTVATSNPRPPRRRSKRKTRRLSSIR